MPVRISTQLPCTADELWQRISRPQSLRFVAAPMLTFTSVEPGVLDRPWEVERDYALNLSLFGLIPLGRHTIRLVTIDRDQRLIISRESGRLARVWNHHISFQELQPGLVNYTDEIEVRAGLLTPVIWVFAHLFYRHRQRRWRVLLHQSGQ